jgi:hypothetical protein
MTVEKGRGLKMALINCPECGKGVASTAVSCPQCGHPFVKPVSQPRVVVREVARKEALPKWLFIPLGVLGILVLVILFVLLRRDDADEKNVNVNIASARQQDQLLRNTSVPSTSEPSTVTIPSTSQPSTVAVPPTDDLSSTTTTVPSTSAPSTVAVPSQPEKSTVALEAKIAPKTGGTPQPVQRVRFYLLDKDLESILSEAKINDELGQGAVTAFALSVVNPNKFKETNQKGFAAIKRHAVYSTTTDSGGKAQIQDVKPQNYYLFAISTTKNGYAIWNSPVLINPGQNSLILEPVMPTEIVDFNQ